MNIHQSQREILQKLRCVRISNHPDAIRLVEQFANARNEVLVDYIKGDAFQDDSSGKAACYIILDEDDDILGYFALKSGLLYDEFKFLCGHRIKPFLCQSKISSEMGRK